VLAKVGKLDHSLQQDEFAETLEDALLLIFIRQQSYHLMPKVDKTVRVHPQDFNRQIKYLGELYWLGWVNPQEQICQEIIQSALI
jgi:hypothetical protein